MCNEATIQEELTFFKNWRTFDIYVQNIRSEMEIEFKEKIRKHPKRIVIELPEDWHYEIKLHAIERNMSVRHWVLQTLMLKIEEQRKIDGKKS